MKALEKLAHDAPPALAPAVQGGLPRLPLPDGQPEIINTVMIYVALELSRRLAGDDPYRDRSHITGSMAATMWACLSCLCIDGWSRSLSE